MALFPHGLDPWGFSFIGIGSWRDVFAVLAVIGIVYGALVALVQTDFKFVIGYSSVSHMGFVLLGLMTLNQIGLTGAVLQMFSHGIIAGLLFAIVGRIVYDRTHTRQFAELETMHLSKRLPFAAWAFVIAGMASMGLPGFSGFVAELQVLVGAWKRKPVVGRRRGRRHRRGRGLHLARAAKGVLQRCAAHAHDTRAGAAGTSWRPSHGLKLPALCCWQELACLSDFIREFCSTRLNRQ